MTFVHVAEAKTHLSRYIAEVEQTHQRVVITKNGLPAAVLIAPDDLESLEETLAIQSDPELMAETAQAVADLNAGMGTELDHYPGKFIADPVS